MITKVRYCNRRIVSTGSFGLGKSRSTGYSTSCWGKTGDSASLSGKLSWIRGYAQHTRSYTGSRSR